jgi:hypothetical protein
MIVVDGRSEVFVEGLVLVLAMYRQPKKRQRQAFEMKTLYLFLWGCILVFGEI